MEIKIKWIKRKQMTHENTYRDDNNSSVTVIYTFLQNDVTKGFWGHYGRDRMVVGFSPPPLIYKLEIQSSFKFLRKSNLNEISIVLSIFRYSD